MYRPIGLTAYTVHREVLSTYAFKQVIIAKSCMNKNCMAFSVLAVLGSI